MQVIYAAFLAGLALGVHAQSAKEAVATDRPASSFGTPGFNTTFDYVIVGGGTAGLTIATRLAQNPSISVAVVEAGGFYEDAGNTSVIPMYCPIFAGTDPADTNPLVDWGFVTTPQAGANDRAMHYARGRTLGGTSARNFMYYHRQTIGSAQQWASVTNDTSYDFSNLLPYYKKSVHYTPPFVPYPNSTNDQDAAAFDHLGGPLQVSHGAYNDPFATWALQGLQKIGQKAINGFESGKLIGSAYIPVTVDPAEGTRSSSETSFLTLALNRTSLQVYDNTLAQKLLFTGNKATGVLVNSQAKTRANASTYILSARKEVIVSAGAFQSPQLLMVSGIGPRATLQQHGIKVLKDLPGVGQNLWDHGYYGVTYRVNVLTSSAGLNNPTLAAAAVQAYVDSKIGPLTVPSTDVIGWEKLPSSMRKNLSSSTQKALDENFPSDWPEIEYIAAAGILGNQSNFLTQDPRDGYNYASIAPALVAPLSRGNISITSASMNDPPLINPNWLTHPADIELAIAAFKRSRQFWESIPNVTIGEEYLPGPQVQTDEQILKYIRENVAPVWHAAATCKMGTEKDSMAVVDSKAKVFGVQGLRVVDASSFPFLPPGHPQATVYALAEKIADEILGGLGNARD